MRKALIMMVLALFGMCGCTQYNGHIGPIFGSWSLVEISEDGTPLKMDETTVFRFQNEVVQITKRVEPPMPSVYRYGNFVKTEETLTFKFQTKPTAGDSHMYMTPEWLHFPMDGTVVMNIQELNGKKMVLLLMSGSTQLKYTFTRTW